MSNVYFITSVGGDIGSAVAKHIKESMPSDKLIGCDIIEYNQGLDYIDEFILAPRYTETEQYWQFINDICARYSVTHFLPMSEGEIAIADQRRDDLKRYKIKALLHNHEFLNIASSKYNTVKFLEKCGVKTPETWMAGEAYEKSYPMVVKAEHGNGSKAVRIVHNEEELNRALIELPQPIVQEYIGTDDEEYTMAVFSDGHRVEEITFRRKLGYGGMSVFVEYVENHTLSVLAQRIAEMSHFIGSINIQMRKNGDDYYVFEINPRISSTIGFRYKLGFKDDIWWIKLLDQEVVNDVYTPPKGPVVGIKVLDERIYNLSLFARNEPCFDSIISTPHPNSDIGTDMGGGVVLRAVEKNDCDLLFEWANDELCRKNSFQSQKIVKSEHQKWFDNIYKSDSKNIFILYIDDIPTAYVREESLGNKIKLSYSVAKEKRGQGYGTLLLYTYGMMKEKQIKSGISLYGEVKKENIASQKIFEKLGYKLKIQKEIYIYYKSKSDGILN